MTHDMPGVRFAEVGEAFNTFYHHRLPFELTEAQKRVLREIRADLNTGWHMNRLLQGDVGSGKTVVALLTALLTKDNGRKRLHHGADRDFGPTTPGRFARHAGGHGSAG